MLCMGALSRVSLAMFECLGPYLESKIHVDLREAG